MPGAADRRGRNVRRQAYSAHYVSTNRWITATKPEGDGVLATLEGGQTPAPLRVGERGVTFRDHRSVLLDAGCIVTDLDRDRTPTLSS